MRNEQIINEYVAGLSAEELGVKYKLTARQIQRIVYEAGKSRTQSESYNLAIKRGRMTYYHKPEHLKIKRKTMPLKIRYQVLERDNHTCQSCGNTVKEGIRIEIDHIDADTYNNQLNNLITLCNLCNQGKAWLKNENR